MPLDISEVPYDTMIEKLWKNVTKASPIETEPNICEKIIFLIVKSYIYGVKNITQAKWSSRPAGLFKYIVS